MRVEPLPWKREETCMKFTAISYPLPILKEHTIAWYEIPCFVKSLVAASTQDPVPRGVPLNNSGGTSCQDLQQTQYKDLLRSQGLDACDTMLSFSAVGVSSLSTSVSSDYRNAHESSVFDIYSRCFHCVPVGL